MPVHSWFLRCSCSIFLSPTWPHKMVSWPSPIYHDSWDKHSRFLSVLFFTASDFTFTTRHSHSCASFLFWPSHFPLFGTNSNCPPFFSSNKGYLLTWGVYLPVSYLFAFSHCSWGLKARILEWFVISSSSVPRLLRTLHYDLSILGGPAQHDS